MPGKISLKNSIQTRLTMIMGVMLGIILLVNLFIYFQINSMVERIDSVFASNVGIEQLTGGLELVQGSVREYLNTKSSVSLENYYRYVQEYQLLIRKLNDQNTGSPTEMLEKNIRNMSESYLKMADDTVKAKRGRNVEQYKAGFERGTLLYRYINDYIYQLNRLQFSQNSQRYQFLLSAMGVLEGISLSIMVLVFLIALFLVIVMIRSMIRPLTLLSDAAALVAQGHFDVSLPTPSSPDEIGIVTQTFGQMLSSIRAYIERQRSSMEAQARMKERELSMEANLKEAQLKFLQAQINPHFLFNSLNAGAQLAMMEDAESTGIFLEKMAEFFRYNLKKIDGVATLEEEIGLVDNYIYILNVRFAGDITYEKKIEEELPPITMPGMILQPLVENAINHGIRDRLVEGIICLTAEREERGILVTVTDNGKGMTREELQHVQQTIVSAESAEDDPGEKTHGNGVALVNVANRLRLFYNREDLLHIYSAGRGEGTEAEVLLPYSKEDSDEEADAAEQPSQSDKEAEAAEQQSESDEEAEAAEQQSEPDEGADAAEQPSESDEGADADV